MGKYLLLKFMSLIARTGLLISNQATLGKPSQLPWIIEGPKKTYADLSLKIRLSRIASRH